MSKPALKQGALPSNIQLVLDEHKKFLDSDGNEGSRASFKNKSLRGKNLKGVDLREAMLQGTKFQNANLQHANLSGAFIKGADFTDAKLQWANLSNTNLQDSVFRDAKLTGTNLENSNLESATLTGASMQQANLSNANLININLSEINLQDTNLSNANMQNCILDNAILSRANLSNANLYGASFKKAVVTQASITDASLIYADLREANLSGADITSANLYQCALGKWIISGIKCNSIYFDKDFSKKFPNGRNFSLGEFEEIYKTLPTIEYYFERGFSLVDQVLIDKVVREINEENPEMGLVLDSFQAKGLCPHIRLTVSKKKYQYIAYEQLKARYEELEMRYHEEKMRFSHVVHALIDKGGSEVHYHKVNKMIGSSTGGNSTISTEGTNSPIQIGTDEATLSYESIGKMADAVDKVGRQSKTDSSLLSKIKEELIKVPEKGVKVLTHETVKWIRENAISLFASGGDGIKAILDTLCVSD